MSNKDNPLLTIREFAEIAGVSRQNIYNQLDGRLSPYVIEIDNIKMIKKTALKYYPNAQSQLDCQVDSQVVQSKKKQDTNDKILETLTKQLEIYSKQLETKDNQIEELNKRLAEMANIVEKQQILLDQQQKLTLIDKQQQEETKEKEEQQEQPQEKRNFWYSFFGK